MSKKLYLGIDAGGTHTDVAVFDPTSKSVVVSAKAETTHHDLSQGISKALAALGRLNWDGGFQAIERFNLSTTLATNSIAEGLSNRIGLILMGYDRDQEAVRRLVDELPLASPVFVAGSHNFYGRQEEPLDEAAIVEAVRALEARVSGWAVSGFFSVKNPGHEMRAARLIKTISAKPVTLGRDLTGQLDAVRRAATAALNAGLVLIINRLLDAVKKSAAEMGLGAAKLMVVKGDGSLVSEEWAREKPIETVVSGPAAGLVGARALARGFLSAEEKDLWVLDVGGTTTDMAFVRAGLPAVNPNGARVGKWKTMTVAVETKTRGLGGDSLTVIDAAGLISLGPRRVLPLCRLAKTWPEALETLRLQKLLNTPSTAAGYFFVPGTPPEPGLNEDESAILAAMAETTPFAMARYAEMLFETGRRFIGLSALSHPSIMVSAFTPTDAMAVLGLYNVGSREAAALGAELLGRRLKLSADQT
ncbi:MAG: hydantoinase/oxoprolinase family protein, partial [Candidatus Adiutrix sp.]|nr:hydantoinase/oxoprolinase family protein [Candidatus Adiutrix sp.]